MFYTIYLITNKVNNKTYIGKHQTNDLDDGYMGSGKLIRRAIKKYGLENFTKEILFIFETEQEMNDKEKELVVIGENSYNLCSGGQGGFGYINTNIYHERNILPALNKVHFLQKTDLEFKKRFSEKVKQGRNSFHEENPHRFFGEDNGFFGKKHSLESRKKMSETRKREGTQKGERNSQFGKPRSDEVKKKISESLKRRQEIDGPNRKKQRTPPSISGKD